MTMFTDFGLRDKVAVDRRLLRERLLHHDVPQLDELSLELRSERPGPVDGRTAVGTLNLHCLP